MKAVFPKRSKRLVITAVIVVFVGTGIQFTSPVISNPPVTGAFKGPDSVEKIFQRACYDCHSNETQLKWFDKIAPASWLVAEHIQEARSRFNFSEWNRLSKAEQLGKLWYMVNMVDQGEMPLQSYTALHGDARLSESDINTLKNYVVALSNQAFPPPVNRDTAKMETSNQAINKSAASTPVGFNGIAYFPDYRNWKVITTSNRFDNNTMRVIYGNDIAIKAIQEGNIHPWPNGSRIVKVVWDKKPVDSNGNVTAGSFNNVQIMIRDDQQYKETDGWGYARFNTTKLKPYGKSAAFATECSNCHRMAAETGFVFDIPMQNMIGKK